MRVSTSILALCSVLTAFSSHAASAAASPARTRIVVLTDIGGREPDDEQSLIRLLAYANPFDIEALIANTSAWQPDHVHPELIRNIVESYGKVRQNLLACEVDGTAPGENPNGA